MQYFLLALLLSSYVLQSDCAWQLVWSDEFDGTTLNTSNWNIANTATVYNNEMEAYNKANVVIGNGSLRLDAKKQSYLGKTYTSGKIYSQNKKSFTYGRFEARMKLPKGKGFWPAFWLWPNDDSLPYREIDIMEAIGSNTKSIETTCWVGGSSWDIADSIGYDYTMPVDYSLDYHIYAAEWKPGQIDYFVDTVKVFTCLKSNAPQWQLDIKTNQMFVIFNLAIGGDMPGSPSSTTVFPNSMYVDYVRVYQDPTVVGNVAKIALSTLKAKEPLSAAACDEMYVTTHLKSSVRFLKNQPPVPTSPIGTLQVDSGVECCDKCNDEESCIAWKFNKGKCSLLEKKEE